MYIIKLRNGTGNENGSMHFDSPIIYSKLYNEGSATSTGLDILG
jgi:hypothetical protein